MFGFDHFDANQVEAKITISLYYKNIIQIQIQLVSELGLVDIHYITYKYNTFYNFVHFAVLVVVLYYKIVHLQIISTILLHKYLNKLFKKILEIRNNYYLRRTYTFLWVLYSKDAVKCV